MRLQKRLFVGKNGEYKISKGKTSNIKHAHSVATWRTWLPKDKWREERRRDWKSLRTFKI